jgi:hypothetical protein
MKKLLLGMLVIALCALYGCDQSDTAAPSKHTPAAPARTASVSDPSHAPTASSISEARLLDDLRSQDFDRVVRTMNDVKGARYAGHLTPIFIDFWNGTDLHGVDKNFLNHPRIRLEIADVLAQQEKNGYQGLDKAAFAQYARGLLSSNDTQVANQAMLVLGIAGSAADMSLLESLAENIAESRFRAAVIALLHNCNTTSALLEKLKASLTETWRKDFLAETREKFGSFQACTSR